MKSVKAFLTMMFILGLLFSPDAMAQPGQMMGKGGMGMKGGGWGPGSPYMRMYNAQTVETITGEVVSIDQVTPVKGMSYGVHLKVKTGTETVAVHLGPAWYINNQEVQIAKGDKLTIKGSKIDFQGKPAIIAAEVTKDDQVLKLRDESGFPVWAGWRRQQMMTQ